MSDVRLLLVEDDEFVHALLSAYLEKEGFKVTVAIDGREAMALIDSESHSLVLLDLNLPDEDGLVLARMMRSRTSVPIIVITSRKDEEDRKAAFEIGANDFLTKPFDPRDLVARVKELIGGDPDGSANGPDSSLVPLGDLTLDFSQRIVTVGNGSAVDLTRGEFNLLAALVRAPNRVLSRAQLLDAITVSDEPPSERTVDVLISRLRRKTETNQRPRLVVTVPGCGYRLSPSLTN